ncbi:MAG TPA: SDR family NAD(P)-dependent oxidoreductase [Fimbriimonadaceae bacterium]|nr:SDR family NAD(P)-dependent oxidoreductase [Fimbriimonadaceae bacterium]
MHVLVTGGSGFIGAALVKRFLKDGHRVRVFDNNSRGRSRRLADVAADIEFIQGDIRDPEAVDAVTKGVEAVAHLAFVNGTEFFYQKPKLVLEVGVKGAIHTLDSAIRHGVPNYWLMSSSEVYQTPPEVPTDESAPFFIPDPTNPRYSYGGGKLISELLAINYGRTDFQHVSVVRPHNVYGPDMGWEHVVPQFVLRAAEAVEEHPNGIVPFPIQGDGSQTRAFCYIDDFTEGCYLAFTKGEHLNIYHVGTQEEVSIRTVAEEVLKQFGRECKILTGDLPEGGTPRRCPDIGKVHKLGYTPQFDLAAGLAPTVAWYRENAALREEDLGVGVAA